MEPVKGAHDGDRPLPSIAVIVATLGRPDIVSDTLNYLFKTQSLKPATVIVSCVVREDAGKAVDCRASRS